ncbi:MAG TPA: glycosyltransferase [Motilibacteraceae bacterium]|nr:glycosyltransferase [Motilibacteraceae bacterium]
MRIVVFGTYDAAAHPRVGVLRDGLRAAGHDVVECDAPLGLGTAQRVAILRQPWRLPQLALRLARCWSRLLRRALRLRREGPVDVVLVGYLGHFDVHLARRLFPRAVLVLDHLVFAADTAADRGERGALKQRLLRGVDAAALRTADVVVLDTDEHAALVPAPLRARAVVVPVGAPKDWLRVGEARPPVTRDGPLRVVFFGLFTPLQGAPVIAAALAREPDLPLHVTMVGGGQDLAAAQRLAGADPRITWVPWVTPKELPALVATHDVCLGVFGTGPKALRVVPNKVFQGAAAGCALVTSDTAPQRRLLEGAAVLVPPGDADALAAALRELAADRERCADLADRARRLAGSAFAPAEVVRPLLARLEEIARA